MIVNKESGERERRKRYKPLFALFLRSLKVTTN
jgi:hypothetical protein